MSTVIVDDGALVLQDPADQRRYTVDWTKNLAAGVIINEIPTFTLRPLNAAAAALFRTVASWVYDSGLGLVTVTTTAPHGYAFLDFVTISGAHEPRVNGLALVLTIVSPTVFQYALGGPPVAATGSLTVAAGVDWTDYLPQSTAVRFTNGIRGAQYEITNRIVTSDSPAQVKTRSFQILIEDL